MTSQQYARSSVMKHTETDIQRKETHFKGASYMSPSQPFTAIYLFVIDLSITDITIMDLSIIDLTLIDMTITYCKHHCLPSFKHSNGL